MLTMKEDDMASSKPIAKARQRQKPTVTLTSVSIPVLERKWIDIETQRSHDQQCYEVSFFFDMRNEWVSKRVMGLPDVGAHNAQTPPHKSARSGVTLHTARALGRRNQRLCEHARPTTSPHEKRAAAKDGRGLSCWSRGEMVEESHCFITPTTPTTTRRQRSPLTSSAYLRSCRREPWPARPRQ